MKMAVLVLVVAMMGAIEDGDGHDDGYDDAGDCGDRGDGRDDFCCDDGGGCGGPSSRGAAEREGCSQHVSNWALKH